MAVGGDELTETAARGQSFCGAGQVLMEAGNSPGGEMDDVAGRMTPVVAVVAAAAAKALCHFVSVGVVIVHRNW